MAFMDSSTFTCPATPTPPPTPTVQSHAHHLVLGQACLEVASSDPNNSLQLWAQAEECYKCPPWYYLTLAPNTTHTLVVNTTYPTNIVITNQEGRDLYSLNYHFGEYGNYHLPLGPHKAGEVEVSRQPESWFIPLFTATLFYALLIFMWQCAKFILRRMDSTTPPYLRRTSDSEGSPVITRRRSSLSSTSTPQQQPQPSTSSQPSTSTSSIPTASSSTAVLSEEHVLSSLPPTNVSEVLDLPDSRRVSGRLLSLDAFRGLAIVLMVFVNYGGGSYAFFKHARWNGLTVADLVFPWFLWIMGVSLIFSIRSQLRRTTKRITIVLRILKRCIILFGLGIVVNSTHGDNYMPTFRVLGVLQRFAICYFMTAVVEVYTMNPQESPQYVWYWRIRDMVRSSPQWMYTLILMILHVALTFGLPVPGCPMGYVGPGGLHEWGMHKGCTGGAAGYIDRVLVGRAHVYSHPTCASVYSSTTPYDPEGLLGVLTSVMMVQFGAACGRIIITYQHHKDRISRWLIWSLVTGLLSGFLCGWRKEGGFMPVNKNLWSLSYVLCTACFAFLLFTLFYVAIDKVKLWSGNPLRYAGMNSILVYVGHEVCGRLLPFAWTPVGQHHANHLVMNLWGTSAWVIIAYLCHKRKIYLSV